MMGHWRYRPESCNTVSWEERWPLYYPNGTGSFSALRAYIHMVMQYWGIILEAIMTSILTTGVTASLWYTLSTVVSIYRYWHHKRADCGQVILEGVSVY